MWIAHLHSSLHEDIANRAGINSESGGNDRMREPGFIHLDCLRYLPEIEQRIALWKIQSSCMVIHGVAVDLEADCKLFDRSPHDLRSEIQLNDDDGNRLPTNEVGEVRGSFVPAEPGSPQSRRNRQMSGSVGNSRPGACSVDHPDCPSLLESPSRTRPTPLNVTNSLLSVTSLRSSVKGILCDASTGLGERSEEWVRWAE